MVPAIVKEIIARKGVKLWFVIQVTKARKEIAVIWMLR